MTRAATSQVIAEVPRQGQDARSRLQEALVDLALTAVSFLVMFSAGVATSWVVFPHPVDHTDVARVALLLIAGLVVVLVGPVVTVTIALVALTGCVPIAGTVSVGTVPRHAVPQ